MKMTMTTRLEVTTRMRTIMRTRIEKTEDEK
jgi:hypothetical protein